MSKGSGRSAGSRSGSPNAMQEQSEANRLGIAQLRKRVQSLSPGELHVGDEFFRRWIFWFAVGNGGTTDNNRLVVGHPSTDRPGKYV